MSEYIVLLSTFPSEDEAEKLGTEMVKKGLVACVNLVPKIRSIYKWKEKVYNEEEILLIMKSRKEKSKEIIEFINNNHSYEVPEVISLSISSGSKRYLAWIDENCG
ncbi:MAG TPA: divalent-cation tolerance protein CutA [Nitrospinota bacterium]|nr:divalent-cation tolerance protein CutA [Nitrospinota bacterium]